MKTVWSTSSLECGPRWRSTCFPAACCRRGWSSLGWGVGEDDTDPTTGLPKAHQGSGGWLAPAQRIPVQLAFDTAGRPPSGVRYNARASVILYTGRHPVANALAWFWIRVISVLTFVS